MAALIFVFKAAAVIAFPVVGLSVRPIFLAIAALVSETALIATFAITIVAIFRGATAAIIFTAVVRPALVIPFTVAGMPISGASFATVISLAFKTALIIPLAVA